MLLIPAALCHGIPMIYFSKWGFVKVIANTN